MFVLPQLIAFEIEGGYHERQGDYDSGRDIWLLQTRGLRTVRFSNEEILRDPLAVKERVASELFVLHLIRKAAMEIWARRFG
jgi:very-short-patch-repair endonuclease